MAPSSKIQSHRSALAPNAARRPIEWRRLWQSGLAGLMSMIFFARFFVPAESAVQGDTLWMAGLSIVVGIVWATGILTGACSRTRFDWIDAAVGLWIGGQIVSAVVVVMTSGEKRMALNLAWEWVGLAVFWVVLRHGLIDGAFRSALIRALIVGGAVLSGYGLYQHWIEHPQLVAEVGPLFDRLRTASGSERDAVAQKLAQYGIPTEGPALVLYEKRLRDSHEPTGLFALANTFGGCLAACLILALGELLQRRFRDRREAIALLTSVILIGGCLLLTKSRTAWIGSFCGAAILLGSQLRIAANVRRVVIAAVLSCATLVVITTALLLLGGLDKQVLSEAPKSLAYRFQYWQATSRLIADHWLLGVGPGNFRQHYLAYKLPEASEEIADPHNFLFEAAATGGGVSLAGLLLFLGTLLASGRRLSQGAFKGNSDSAGVAAEWNSTFWLAPAGSLLAFSGLLALEGQWEDRVLVLGFLWLVAAWVFVPLVGRLRQTSANDEKTLVSKPNSGTQHGDDHGKDPQAMLGALAAATALAVHLLGAGGFSMPVVMQMLLVLVALSLPPSAVANSVAPTVARLRGLGAVMTLILLAAGLGVTGLIPVTRCRLLLDEGTALGSSSRSDRQLRATELFQAAAIADPWSPDPWRYQVEQAVGTGEIRSNESFAATVEHLNQAMIRDPFNFWGPQAMGRLWRQQWQRNHQPEEIGQAVAWLKKASDLYPTNSTILAELAVSYQESGDMSSAARSAKRSIDQDETYRRHGHVDRYLDDKVRKRMESLMDGIPDSGRQRVRE